MIYSENEKKHLNHKFYQDVQNYRELVRIGQILKGSHKYPEPFNTASWTNVQLIEHAMQENVDQSHYIYALYERTLFLEKRNMELEELVKQLQLGQSDKKAPYDDPND